MNTNAALSLDVLALIHQKMGHYADAAQLFQRVLTIQEKTFGPTNTTVAYTLDHLALLYEEMGNYSKAEPIFLRVLAIYEKIPGKTVSATQNSLNGLAMVYLSMGEYAKAEPLFLRIQAIAENSIAGSLNDANILRNFAFVEIGLGKSTEALDLERRFDKAHTSSLDNVLSFTSEQQRLAFQKEIDPFSIAATLGSSDAIANEVLHNKGLVLDSLLEDRLVAEATKDPKERALIDEIRIAKARLAQSLHELPKGSSTQSAQRRIAERDEQEKNTQKLEAQLAEKVAGLGNDVHFPFALKRSAGRWELTKSSWRCFAICIT